MIMRIPGDAKYTKAVEIVKRLRSAGHEAYFAGGCVRDMLMNRAPKDYDIATDATPDQVESLFSPTIGVGKAFGVTVVLRGQDQYEVASFRWDGPYKDGRHPEFTKFSSKEDDIARRDFTVNGMFFDPLSGQVLDLHGGQVDIERKLIRAIGEATVRFNEDRLRMLRAVRFACQLDFEIEEETFQAIRKMARSVRSVSWERIADELKRILVSEKRRKGVELLDKAGLLEVILPEVSQLKGVPQPPQFHPEGDVFLHTLLCLDALKDPSWPLALATLLHDIGKPATMQVLDRIRFHEHETLGARMTKKICNLLRMSNEDRDTTVWLVERHMVFKDVPKMRQSTLKRLFAHPHYKLLEELHRVDKLASDGDMSTLEFCRTKYAEFGIEEIKPPRLVTGHDIMELGVPEGPEVGRILRAVEDAQLEGQLKTKEEAIEFAKNYIAGK